MLKDLLHLGTKQYEMTSYDLFEAQLQHNFEKQLERNSFKWFFGNGQDDFFVPIAFDFAIQLEGFIPNVPAVYFLFNENKELMYIGKSTKLKSRLKSHFYASQMDISHYCFIKPSDMGWPDEAIHHMEKICINRHKPPMNKVIYNC